MNVRWRPPVGCGVHRHWRPITTTMVGFGIIKTIVMVPKKLFSARKQGTGSAQQSNKFGCMAMHELQLVKCIGRKVAKPMQQYQVIGRFSIWSQFRVSGQIQVSTISNIQMIFFINKMPLFLDKFKDFAFFTFLLLSGRFKLTLVCFK